MSVKGSLHYWPIGWLALVHMWHHCHTNEIWLDVHLGVGPPLVHVRWTTWRRIQRSFKVAWYRLRYRRLLKQANARLSCADL